MQWLIDAADDGMCVREYIRAHAHLSTKMLKFLKYREDGILVNGERVTVRRVLRKHDILTLSIPDSESAAGLEPVDLPLEILYEDDGFVIPCKPAGMPTHPSHGHWNDTVANALAFRYASRGIPFVFRPVNRLDRDTSGLLIVARNKLAAGRLTQAMQAGLIRKTYLAVLEGEDCPDAGVINKPLHRTAQSVIVREVCSPDAPDAEPSRTEFRVLARGGGCALVEAKPLTGRTHQLRVHFASIGHPIAGDTLYGIPNDRISRQALHAATLTLPHPSTGEQLTVCAPLPDDMQCLIRQCFSELPDNAEPFAVNTDRPHDFPKGEPT